MAVSFVDCPRDQVEPLRAFFAAMYSPEYVLGRDEEFLRWQFGPTPASQGDHYHLILALVDGEIRGCIGYIPIELSIAGRIVNAAWAANWMVDQTTRRLGLGPLLMRELTRRFDVTLALGGNRDAHDLLPRMGWQDYGLLSRFVCVLDRRQAAALTPTGGLEWPAEAVFAEADDGVTVVDAFASDVVDVWDREWGASAAGSRRTAEFLNWRYARHPLFDHHLVEIRRDGVVTGLGVSRIEQVRDSEIRLARILEVIAEPADVPRIVGALLRHAHGSGAALADFFCASGRMANAFWEAGFRPGDVAPASDIPILFQPLDRTRKGILFMAHLQKVGGPAIADWYVTKSDGDQDRPS